MIWLLRDFDLLSVLLRAAALGLEAVTLGGGVFLLAAVWPFRLEPELAGVSQRWLRRGAFALASVEALFLATNSATLSADTGLGFGDIATSGFFLSGGLLLLAAVGIGVLAKAGRRWPRLALLLMGLLVLAAQVSGSHAASRLDNRPLLASLTTLHHLGMAVWLGMMPFLLMTLAATKDVVLGRRLVSRYSWMAIAAVATLVVSGVVMARFYVGGWGGLYGSAYGLMLLAKIYLMLLMLVLGSSNVLLERQIRGPQAASLLARLRRFGEAEIGLGFTVVLAAASLTSQPPAADVRQDWVSGQVIGERMKVIPPRLQSPPLAALAPPTSMQVAVEEHQFHDASAGDANDRAWSEYNHHWAGLAVVLAGLLALLSRWGGARWARNWPLAFAGLAVFILLRADPENWPLGPRPFWQSFAQPDVLEHRLYAVLILAFVAFEWGVAVGRLRSKWAALVFPAICAVGGALLLTHSHGLGDPQEELLAEMSHASIAVLGVTAGWSRWLELRAGDERSARWAGRVWPVCLVLVGLLLVNYREG